MLGMRCCCATHMGCEMKQERQLFFAHSLVMDSQPRFKFRERIYFASTSWILEERWGKKFYSAQVLALHDAVTDEKILHRILVDLGRSKARWDFFSHEKDMHSPCLTFSHYRAEWLTPYEQFLSGFLE